MAVSGISAASLISSPAGQPLFTVRSISTTTTTCNPGSVASNLSASSYFAGTSLRGYLTKTGKVFKINTKVNAVVVATPAAEETIEYVLPTWAEFDIGKAPVFWKTMNGLPPTSGEQLRLFYNPAANKLVPNEEFGVAFNGGFNQPIMCGGEPRSMLLKVRGKADPPMYTIRICIPKHAWSLIFSFTNGNEWDGPYKLEFKVPKAWKNKPIEFFNENEVARERDRLIALLEEKDAIILEQKPLDTRSMTADLLDLRVKYPDLKKAYDMQEKRMGDRINCLKKERNRLRIEPDMLSKDLKDVHAELALQRKNMSVEYRNSRIGYLEKELRGRSQDLQIRSYELRMAREERQKFYDMAWDAHIYIIAVERLLKGEDRGHIVWPNRPFRISLQGIEK